jgi:hypothetical protein
MIGRIFIIARITLTEAIRQKVLNILLLFGLVMISASSYFSQVAVEQQIKFVKDFGCGAIGLIGVCIAILSVAQLLPQELHNRTIYTTLAKPVRRVEFLLGKFFGVVLLLALSVALMCVAFAAVMWWQEQVGIEFIQSEYPARNQSPDVMSAYNHELAQFIAQAQDPQLISAIALIFAKLIMASAMALLISTFSTSFIFTVITTAMLYIIGHLESTARDVWLGHGANATLFQKGFLELVSLVIPDMNAFTIVDEILDGNVVPLAHTFNLLGYASVYTIVLLALSELVFEFREL